MKNDEEVVSHINGSGSNGRSHSSGSRGTCCVGVGEDAEQDKETRCLCETRCIRNARKTCTF